MTTPADPPISSSGRHAEADGALDAAPMPLPDLGRLGVVPLPLDESLRRIGAYVWLESRLFETVGRWVEVVAEPAIRERFGVESGHYGWHAELWFEQLPELHGRAPDELVRPPRPGLAAWLVELADAGDARVLEKAVGLYRVVLPRLVSTYRHHLDRTAAVSDGPVRRWLRIVLDDHLADWRSGEGLVEALLTTDEAIERAAAWQARLEISLLRAGGLDP